jgi:hypothetical protein
MDNYNALIDKIFESQDENGFWKLLSVSDKYYPDYMHYVPNFKSTLWTLILLADIGCDSNDQRVKRPLKEIQNHFFDANFGVYTLKEDHFPIPCLNGNMIYIDCYFNGMPGKESLSALDFFYKYQRFDDGSYEGAKNKYCSNTSCYGKHSCYWGIVKLLKGISFIPKESRTKEILDLLDRCIRFVLLHKVCYSSHKPDNIMIQKMDLLTFPNMYKSDFLEILWLLKREGIISEALNPALKLLQSKQLDNGYWHLERKVHNMVAEIGQLNHPNWFLTNRANEVLEYYENHTQSRIFGDSS